MKRLKGLLILVLTLCALCLFASAAAAYALGDVDGSGEVAVDDARLALRAAVGLEGYAPDSAEFIAADVDYSGELDVSDARLILRSAVGLTDLSEILPESAKLTEEEILARSKECTVVIRRTRLGLEWDSYGIILDKDGLVLTTGYAVCSAEKLQALTPDGEPLKIKEILAYDQTEDLVLLRLEGSFAPAVVNNTAYGAGDAVFYDRRFAEHLTYFVRDSDLRRGTIVSCAEDPGEDWFPRQVLISMNAERLQRMGDSELPMGLPMMDAYGRVLGICHQRYNGYFRAASIRSCLEILKDRTPVSVEAFCAEMSRVEITPSFTEVTVFPGATAACFFEIEGATSGHVHYSSDADHINVIPVEEQFPENGLYFSVLRYGPDAHIRIWSDVHPAESEVIVTIHIADPETGEALINIGGLAVPDFGAITGIPASWIGLGSRVNEGYANGSICYPGQSVSGTDELQLIVDVFAYWADQMGYYFHRQEESYWFLGGDGMPPVLAEIQFYFVQRETNTRLTLSLECLEDGTFDQFEIQIVGTV